MTRSFRRRFGGFGRAALALTLMLAALAAVLLSTSRSVAAQDEEDVETNATIRKGATWMVAFAQVQVPIFTVLLRRSFGVAGNYMATPRRQPDVRVTWPAADVGGIPPEGGIEAAYKRQLAEAADPVGLRAELEARIESVRGPIGPLNRFQLEELIDPRDTRRLIGEWIPLATRVATAPHRLVPRALGYRP